MRFIYIAITLVILSVLFITTKASGATVIVPLTVWSSNPFDRIVSPSYKRVPETCKSYVLAIYSQSNEVHIITICTSRGEL